MLCSLTRAVPAVFDYTLTELGTLSGGGTRAFGINNAGVIVGLSGDGLTTPFVYSNGIMTAIGLGSAWTGVTDSQQIVGNHAAYATPTSYDAYVAANGPVAGLGTMGGEYSFAFAMNSGGDVVGYAHYSAPDPFGLPYDKAFLYTGGSMIDLGTLGPSSIAFGLNSTRTVVGYNEGWGAQATSAPPSARHAFVYDNGVMRDLNDITDFGTSNFSILNEAWDVNDLGQIVGFGINDTGQQRAFLLTPIGLTPVPEPATYGLIGAFALLGLSAWRFGQRHGWGRRDARTP